MIEIIINFLISFAASAAFYIYIEKLKKPRKESNNISTSKKYIKAIKFQFYLCFLIAVPVSLFIIIKNSSNFFDVFTFIVLFFLFIFALFAFMCAIEVIYKLSKNNSEENPDDYR